MRNRATEAEKILWSCLKDSKQGFKFVRQYSVEGYVIDFYCPDRRFAIEIDGGYHLQADQKIYDSYRTRILSAYSIELIRFSNREVKEELNKVLISIKKCLVLPS